MNRGRGWQEKARTRWWTAGLVCSLALVVGCTTVPETGRRQFNLLSPAQELELGFSSFQQLKHDVPINHDPKLNAQLQRVGERIARVAPVADAQWEFVLFESEQANAFALPGGKVGVYTGILPITKNDAGLATVLAHEIAHVTARHGGERMTQAMMIQAGGSILGASLSAASPQTQSAIAAVYGLGAQLGYALPYSRLNESEADEIGLLYMARAGYDPEEAIRFWRRFAVYGQGKGADTPWFLRTHPLDEVRIRHLQQWLPRAKAEFQAR